MPRTCPRSGQPATPSSTPPSRLPARRPRWPPCPPPVTCWRRRPGRWPATGHHAPASTRRDTAQRQARHRRPSRRRAHLTPVGRPKRAGAGQTVITGRGVRSGRTAHPAASPPRVTSAALPKVDAKTREPPICMRESSSVLPSRRGQIRLICAPGTEGPDAPGSPSRGYGSQDPTGGVRLEQWMLCW
jgi:hypothetical protein